MDVQKILAYYLECIAKDADTSASFYYSSKEYTLLKNFSLSLAEYATNGNVKYIIDIQKRDSQNKETCIGYPLYVKSVQTKSGRMCKIVEPVFIIPVSNMSAQITKAKLNKAFVESMLHTKSAMEVMQETLDIYSEIGYFREDAEYISCLQNIQKAREEYPFLEEIDASKTSAIDIAKIDSGIVNKTMFFVMEKEKYTEGLEKELLELKQKYKKEDLNTCVLDVILQEQKVAKNAEEIKYIEVLDTNKEQKEAIKKALTNQITLIKGPPGTGKSQVVTNIILNAIYNGKTVLFSSKNHKAVDVVAERVNLVCEHPCMQRVRNTRDIKEVLLPYIEKVLTSSFAADKDYYKAICYALEVKGQKLLEAENRYAKYKEELLEVEEKRKKASKILDKVCIEKFLENKERLEDISLAELEKLNKMLNASSAIDKIKLAFSKGKIQKSIEEEASKINRMLLACGLKEKVNSSEIENTLKEMLTLKSYYFYLDAAFQIDLDTSMRKVLKLKQEYIELSREVLTKFLENKTINLSYKDRQNLDAYKNMLKSIATNSSVITNKTFVQNFNLMGYKINNIMPAMAVTSLSIRGKIPLAKGIVDLVVIDEASQCDIASIIPLMYRARNIVLIGDDKQLEHITKVSPQEDCELMQKYGIDNPSFSYKYNSAYSLLDLFLEEENKVMLKEHHRSCKEIIEFSNERFYGNNLKVATDYSKLKCANMSSRVNVINVKGKTEKYRGSSACNKEEVDKVIEALKLLLREEADFTVGVVTPFRGQAELLKQEIAKEKDLEELFETRKLLIDTVNKFQGDERDVVIFSLCEAEGITSTAENFLVNTEKLFNVALTRARANLILVCDRAYITSKCKVKYLKEYFSYLEKLFKEKKEKILAKEEEKLLDILFAKGYDISKNVEIDAFTVDAIVDGKLAILFGKTEEVLMQKLIKSGYKIICVKDFMLQDALEKVVEKIGGKLNE